MLVGYMRVSSDSDRQSTDLQRDALLAAGIDPRHLFEDRASGAKDDRAGLARALEFVRPGDVLVVWKLDRLGRSLSHRHCCKVSDEAAFCLIQRPYISKTLLTRRISPRGSP